MPRHRIFTTSFASVYPHYVRKAEAKGRERGEVDQVICWLTGYTSQALAEQIERKTDFETFFAEAPALHPNVGKITGVVCGVQVEEVEDPLNAEDQIPRQAGRRAGEGAADGEGAAKLVARR